ncbi:MAG: BTAD domain-containing putative transcriptional regulator [Chloroflexota bacterium]
MAAGKTQLEPPLMAAAWERLLHLESEVRELRRILLPEDASAEQARAGHSSIDLRSECSPGGAVSGRLGAGASAQLNETGIAVSTAADVHTWTGAAAGSDRCAAHWHVTFLGPFQLRCAGQDVPVCSSRRGWGILQFLLVSPGFAATRDTLIDAFWPEADPSAGAHNLQMAIHALRRALREYGPDGGNETVLFRDGQYVLNPALSVDLDIDRFRAASTRGRRLSSAGHHHAARRAYEEALAIYRGPFLAERGYDEWAEPHRQALQELRLSVLGWLSSLCAALGEWEQAVAACREVLAVDPYREDAIRQLLHGLGATGRLAEIERTYRAFRQHIWHDLQIEPAPETVSLYRRLTRPALGGATAGRTGAPRAIRAGS